VEYLGFLPDLAPWFDQLRLSVAPLRFGAGMKGKVSSSLAAGVPCIVTPLAAEGMALTHGENVLVAVTPEQFAAEIIHAYRDQFLWDRLSREGQATIDREYSLSAYNYRFHEMLIQVGLPCMTPV
jgi:glycosyltransferase involved in cell wall biosynthesis